MLSSCIIFNCNAPGAVSCCDSWFIKACSLATLFVLWYTAKCSMPEKTTGAL